MTLPLRPMLLSLLLAVALSPTACRTASRAHSDDDLQLETTVSVENHDFLDMTVYVLEGAQRIRLGVAPGHNTTTLTIPEYLVRAANELQFLCDPIGASRTPVSERITVFPGDQVLLIVDTGM